ncbi:MAG: 4-(cytidine 5'-diphospho)-2-C-methyl-D-erythritol kinase [Bacteroidia bacterium]|nr:4-(cytidine 5'-diphospho)-2-C-methyl-D-erythritol kinase [Bacteroidia bacterium]
MVTFPHCKINLGLNVIARRGDGFHDIETCFYPIPWTDILEIIPSSKLHFDTTGLVIPGQKQENLCLKAFDLLKKDFDLTPVHIHLHKLLPTGAGLGGGSSDAAFTLRTLNEIFNLNLSVVQLSQYASILGSDCSFFTQQDAMLGTSRGEILTPINVSLKGKFIVLVNPEIHVSTSEAYTGVVTKKSTLSIQSIIESKSLEKWKDFLINDFEECVFKKYPRIGELKDKLYQAGAVYASMSGSGSAVFGIFDQAIDLRENFDGMTCWSGDLN